MANRGNDVSAEHRELNIAVIGAGLIGERHVQLVNALADFNLFATVDPVNRPSSNDTVPHFENIEEFLAASDGCEGVIIATPNHTHKSIAEKCMRNGLACLIEKPLAANSVDAVGILKVSEDTGCPVLVGHHRRHHAVSLQLKEIIESGKLGRLVGAQLSWMLLKPDEYFAAGDWRTKAGGGPVWINLIHEIDLLRFFMGEITEVSAMLSNAVRGTEAEDSGVINMRFENGAIASAILSDTAPSPWHFEGGSGENPNIARTGEDGLRVFGTKGAISFPSMTYWAHENEEGHWGTRIDSSTVAQSSSMGGEAALTAQLTHFGKIIRDGESPLVSARDGLQSVRVVETIHRAAVPGKTEPVDLN